MYSESVVERESGKRKTSKANKALLKSLKKKEKKEKSRCTMSL